MRTNGWRARLSDYFERVRAEPHAWGTADCACFSAGAAVAQTGDDPMAAFRGKYQTALGAKRLLKKLGFTSLGDLAASVLPEIHPSQARYGDIGLIATDGPFGEALCVVGGERLLVQTEAGLDASRDRTALLRAFRV